MIGIRPTLLEVGRVRTRLREFFRRYGHHTSVALLCLIPCIVLWVVVYMQMNIEREHIIESTRQENDNLARVFEEHVARTIRAAEITLREIASEYQRYGRKFDLVQYAKDREIYLDPYNILSISDENGDAVMGSIPAPKPVNYRENDNNQYHARHDTPEIFIGKPRIGTTTGKWTVYLSVRINKADGSFGGIAILGMDPAYFSKIYAELDLGQDAIVAVTGRDGVIRVRSSGVGLTVGDNVADTALFTRYLPAANHGSFIDASSADKIKRLFSYRALTDYPLVVLVGTSMAVAFADYDKHQSIFLQAASGMTAVILCLGLFALFQIARSERESEERRRGERLFRTLADGSPVGIFRVDAAGKYVYVNSRWCEIAGTRPEAALDDGWASALHPDDRERIFGEWAAAENNRQPFRSEHRFQKPDGTVTWVVAQALAETDPQGKVLGYVGTITDITDHKQAEAKLRHRTEIAQLLESLARTASEATTSETAMRGCLARICEYGGWAIGRLGIYGDQADDTVFPERSFWDTAETSRYEEFMRASLDSRFYHPDGRFISLLLREKRPVWFSPLSALDSNGRMAIAIRQGLHCAFAFPVVVRNKVVAVLEFFAAETRPADALLLENITNVGSQLARLVERGRAEAVRGQLAAIVEQSSDAIVSRALDGTVLSWNTGAERVLGYTAGEAIGRDFTAAYSPDLWQEAMDVRRRVATGVTVPYFETVRITKDGRRIDVGLNVTQIRDSSGNVIGTAAILRDITERKRAEERQRAGEVRVRELLRRLVETQEGERWRFAADLHDVVGQNLSALEIELERLRGALPSGNARDAETTLDNMAQIIQDTTNSVRETIADLRPALLDDYGVFVAIEGYASRIERLTGLHISVRGNAPETRPPGKTELALFRIVQEALMNAVKHAAASRVTVELSRVGDVLRLRVEDDGKGIACTPPGLSPAGGWGIEFMSERAEALGGALRMESPGVGTRVIVEIPLGN